MEVPDVIYVGIRDIGSGYVTDVSIYPEEEHQEYIHKDALLEWAEEQAETTKKLNGKGAMLKAWDSLIDKINSL